MDHFQRSLLVKVFCICLQTLATNDIKLPQTKDIPNSTNPATKLGTLSVCLKRLNENISPIKVHIIGIAISTYDIFLLKHPLGFSPSFKFLLLLGISKNFVDDNATVDTQHAISPTPKPMFPATKYAGFPPLFKAKYNPPTMLMTAHKYPMVGRINLKNELYLFINCLIIVAAVVNKAIHMAVKNIIT